MKTVNVNCPDCKIAMIPEKLENNVFTGKMICPNCGKTKQLSFDEIQELHGLQESKANKQPLKD